MEQGEGALRWRALWRTLGAATSGREVLESLIERYGEPHRAYHNLDHVLHGLKWFDEARHGAARPEEVEAALWFHDVVYDPHAAENEERSAQWATERLSAAHVSAERIARVAALVLATRHDRLPVDGDAALVMDIDLAILGEESAAFDDYERRIREEYAWVPEATFRVRRAALLEAFLARSALYHTPFFKERLESRARGNLERSIRRLKEVAESDLSRHNAVPDRPGGV